MRVVLSVLGLAVAASVHMTGASAQAPGVADGCYARDYAKGEDAQDYAWVQIAIGPATGWRSEELPVDVTVKYAHISLPTADFTVCDGCKRVGATIACQATCGGVSLRLRPLGGGDLLVESNGYSAIDVRLSSLLLLQEDSASSFFFTGTHVLRRVPAEQCDTDKTVANDTRVLFQPGDYHPKVALISKHLAKLGFLSAPPDYLYTKETAAAMSAFQQSMGYEPTGNADARSVRALTVRAVTMGGY